MSECWDQCVRTCSHNSRLIVSMMINLKYVRAWSSWKKKKHWRPPFNTPVAASERASECRCGCVSGCECESGLEGLKRFREKRLRLKPALLNPAAGTWRRCRFFTLVSFLNISAGAQRHSGHLLISETCNYQSGWRRWATFLEYFFSLFLTRLHKYMCFLFHSSSSLVFTPKKTHSRYFCLRKCFKDTHSVQIIHILVIEVQICRCIVPW